MTTTSAAERPAILSATDILTHWQGHRRLTRRVIEAFPEDQLFTFSIAGMRPFGEMALELWDMLGYNLKGMATDDWSWQPPDTSKLNLNTRAALLAAWDAQTPELDAALPAVDPGWFTREQNMVWGPLSPHGSVAYAIDNEIHHRGEGYVYLRALGIEPPPFPER